MSLTVSLLGVPEAPTEESIDIAGGTLADLRAAMARRYPDALDASGPLLAFVNRRAAGEDWQQVRLDEDDHVILLVPVSGG